jgi:hypothetical protein
MTESNVEKFKHNLFYTLPACWAAVFEGLAGIFTLGYYQPTWQNKYLARAIRHRLMLRKAF